MTSLTWAYLTKQPFHFPNPAKGYIPQHFPNLIFQNFITDKFSKKLPKFEKKKFETAVSIFVKLFLFFIFRFFLLSLCVCCMQKKIIANKVT